MIKKIIKKFKNDSTVYLRQRLSDGSFEVIKEDDLNYVADSKIYKVFKVTDMEEIEVTINVKIKE